MDLMTFMKDRVVPIYLNEPPEDEKFCEIALRSKEASTWIEKRAKKGLQTAAGTVLTLEDLKTAMNSGASFAITPIFNELVVETALEEGFPIIPGVQTANEIFKAIQHVKLIKFFPAYHIRTVIAPFLHTGAKFIATGSVQWYNYKDYLNMEGVHAVTGTGFVKS